MNAEFRLYPNLKHTVSPVVVQFEDLGYELFISLLSDCFVCCRGLAMRMRQTTTNSIRKGRAAKIAKLQKIEGS